MFEINRPNFEISKNFFFFFKNLVWRHSASSESLKAFFFGLLILFISSFFSKITLKNIESQAVTHNEIVKNNISELEEMKEDKVPK